MVLIKIQIPMPPSRPPGSGLERQDPGSLIVTNLVVLPWMPKICVVPTQL